MEPSTAAGSWAARPGLSRLLRVVARIAPLVAGMLVAFAIAQRWPRSHGGGAALLWWVIVLAASATVMVAVERLSRRLLPLSALFSLSLAFPDQAPSRFRSALRSGNSKTLLARRAEFEHGTDEDEDTGQQTAYVAALLTAISGHDRLTRGHVERVRAYSQMIGEELGLSPEDMDRLQWAALLHDAGKIDVPAEILSKPSALTDEEYTTVKAHPADGGRWVAPLRPWLGDWLDATTQHHERFDGGGYPLGLTGKDLSFSSRIVAVADAYDVITATRSYKAPLSAETARRELTAHAGTQFDPTVVRAFLNASVGHTRSVGVWGWLLNIPVLSVLTAPAAASVATAVAAVGVVAGGVGLVDVVDAGPVELGEATIEIVAEELPDSLAFSDTAFSDTAFSDTAPSAGEPPTTAPVTFVFGWPTTSSSSTTVPGTFIFGWPTTTSPAGSATSSTTVPSGSGTTTTSVGSTTTTGSSSTTTTTTTTTATTTTTTPAGCDAMELIAAGDSLAGCDLSGLNLSGVDLRGLDFDEAILVGADLSDADLRDAILTRADLTDADISHARLDNANLTEANLAGADGSWARFDDADLTGANLEGADLNWARFDDADLTGANLRTVGGANIALIGATLDGADFTNANLNRAQMRDASAIGAVFTDAGLQNAELRRANLTGASLVRANVHRADFDTTNFTGATLFGANGTPLNIDRAVWASATCPDGSTGNCGPTF